MKKQLSALLAAALCAGALAGCGANSNSANAATSGAEDTVTLAVVSPVTGDSAEYGIHFNVGAQMAADKINEAGGINGKQVVLKSFDSKNDAKEAAEVARLICQDKTVLATIGDFSSTCCMATAPIYEENKTVQISPSAGLIDFPRVGPYNFSTTGVQENDGGFLMNRVINEKMGAKSVAIVYTNNDYGLNMLSYMTQEAEADGVVITDTEAIASGEKDFTAIVSKMRQTEPEAVAIMHRQLEICGAPRFTQQDKDFAAAIQKELGLPGPALEETLRPLGGSPRYVPGSTDVSAVSWRTPTVTLNTVCQARGIPGHHWSVTACSGAELGRTGMSKAAQIMACFGRELCLQPVLLRKARDEFEQARCQE